MVDVIRDGPVNLTEEQYNVFMYDYNRAFAFHVGSIPTFEIYVRQRLAREQKEQSNG